MFALAVTYMKFWISYYFCTLRREYPSKEIYFVWIQHVVMWTHSAQDRERLDTLNVCRSVNRELPSKPSKPCPCYCVGNNGPGVLRGGGTGVTSAIVKFVCIEGHILDTRQTGLQFEVRTHFGGFVVGMDVVPKRYKMLSIAPKRSRNRERP